MASGRRALRRAVVGAAALVLVAAGCSAPPPQTTAVIVQDALEEGESAAQTAILAVDLLADGRATVAVTDTALADTLGVLSGAEGSIARLLPPDPEAEAVRAAGMDALGEVTDAVTQARAWAGGGLPGEADRVRADLEAAADAVEQAMPETP